MAATPVAEVTYNRGASCTVGAVRFYRDKTRLITNSDVARRASVMRGFTVRWLDPPKLKKVRKVVRRNGKKRSSKKKTSSRRRSDD